MQLSVDDGRAAHRAVIHNGLVRPPLAHAEVQTLLEVCRMRYPQHYPFLLTYVHTRLHLGELVALRWQDVDIHRRSIMVRRTYQEDVEVTAPKRRIVRLTDRALAVLATHRGERVRGLVFRSQTGTRVDLANFRKRAWRRLLLAAGCHPCRLEDLRRP